jgi:hypothetical protein
MLFFDEILYFKSIVGPLFYSKTTINESSYT